MSLTKDGFYKSFSGAIGNNNYLLEAGGGHIGWGNAANQIPYSNGTVNTSLNADMTDGLHVHSGRNNEANKIVRTDGNGYIQAGWINTTSGDMGTTAIDRIYCSNDGYIRYKTVANFKTALFGGQVGSPSVPIYWTGSAFATCIVSFGNSSYGEHNANNINDNGIKYYNANGPSTSLGASTGDGALYSQAYSTSWVAQIAQDYRNGGLYVRGKNNGTWQSWYRVWDNRTTYVSGGKGYIGGTEITQVNNSDTVDSMHANEFVPKRHTPRFYPFVNSSYGQPWYKITLPWAGYTSGSNAWMMTTMEIVLGGSYSSGNNGRIYLQYYFYKNSSNSWGASDVRGTCIGYRLIENGVTIKYDIANPGIFYIKANANTYNSIALENITANDTAPNFDFRNTTIEAIAESSVPSAANQTVPLYHTITTQNGYWANLAIQTSPSTSTSPTVSTIYASNWFRSTGATGWYSESYGGGIRMTDSSWIRTYGSKNFYVEGGNFAVSGSGAIGTTEFSDKLRVYGGIIRVDANGVYLRIGPQNSSHCHYETNAGTSHWFNKMIHVNGHVYPYSGNSFDLGGSSNKWRYFYLNNRAYLDEWIQFSAYTGLYWPNANNQAHFHPNNNTSYGTFTIRGNRNGYSGIQLGTTTSYMTIMDNGNDKGAYEEDWGWIWYFNRSNKRLSLRSSSSLGYDISLYGSTALANQLFTSKPAQSWVGGMTNAAIVFGYGQNIDASSYWPFWSMKDSSGNVVNWGGLGNMLGFHGYYAGRTANDCDWRWRVNASNGYWEMLRAYGVWHPSYQSIDYFLTSNGDARHWSWLDNHYYRQYNTDNINPNYGNSSLFHGYGTGMSTQHGIETGGWYHIWSSGWSDNSNWISQIAIPTVDYWASASAWYRTIQGSNYAWRRILDQRNYRASYGTTGGTSYIQIKINSTTSWMLSFKVRVYQSYQHYDIVFSGYNYGGNYWYSPQVRMASSTNTSITCYFGYDSAWNLWVGIPGASYTGVEIVECVNGYSQTGKVPGDLFTISNVSSFSGTVQSTQTAYAPWSMQNRPYWANVQVSDTSSTSTWPTFGSAYSYDWWRSYNATGWYNQSYGGGIWMTDSSWIRTYGSKHFYVEGGNFAVSGNAGIGRTSMSYRLDIQGDSYARGWHRADSGFYCEGTGVHFTHQGSVGEIDMTSNNEFLWGSSGSSLYFNYRTVSRGTTVTNYIWNAGSSSTYADHNIGKLHVRPTSGNYAWNEGIRLHPASNGWATFILCGTDNTGDSGTSANSWSLHAYGGNFYLSKNGSTGGTSYMDNISNKWYFNTTSGGEAVNVGGWINTVGACGWYNSTYGGGMWMNDSTYVRVYNGKYLYTTYQYYDVGNADYTIDHVYASNDRFIRPMAFSTFGNKLRDSGYLDGRYLRYSGWWNSGSGQSVDNASGMIFAYGNHGVPGSWGIVATFDYQLDSSYRLQLYGDGWNSNIYYRVRSSDRGGWYGGWKHIYDDGYHPLADKLTITGYQSDGLSFYQTSSSFQGSDSSWASYIIANHGNGSTYYNYILRLPFWGPPQYARKENGTNTSWYTFLTTENGYWADQRLQTSSNAYTVPSFAAIKIRNYSPAYHSADNIISGTAGEIYFAGNFHIDSRGSNKLYLNHYTSNSIAMVTGGGNVGIGTDSPSYGLTLATNKRLYIEGNESNPIYTEYHGNSHISTNSPEGMAAIRHGFIFKWYDTYWKIGNVRGGSTNSAGFGIAYSGGAQLQLLVRPGSKTWIYYGIHSFASSQSWTNNPESGNNGISIKSTNGGMTPYIHFIPYSSTTYTWRFATYNTSSPYGYEKNLILYQGPTSGTNTTYAEYIFRGSGYGGQGQSYVATCEGNAYNLVILGVFTLSRLRPSSSTYSVYQKYGLIEPVIRSQVRNQWKGQWYTMDGGMIIEMQMRSGYQNYTTKTTINVVSAIGVICETWIGKRQIGVARDVQVFHGSMGSFDIAVTSAYPTPYTNNSSFEQTNVGSGRYLVITNRAIAGWSSNGGIGRQSWMGLYENREGACITFKVTCFGYMS